LPDRGLEGSFPVFPFPEESVPDESSGIVIILLGEDITGGSDVASQGGSFAFFLLLSASRFPVVAPAMGQESHGEGLELGLTSAASLEGSEGDTCALLAGAGMVRSSVLAPRF
jgi:hypothetical protein